METSTEDFSLLGRRKFLQDSLALPPLIAALFASSVLISCRDDGGSNSGGVGGGGSTDGIAGSIGAPSSLNHGHSVRITQAQLDAGNGVTLTLTGAAHLHTVTLLVQDVLDIAAGTQVSKLTSVNVHTHTATFN